MLQPEQFIRLLRCASEAARASVLHVRRVQAAVESLLKTSKAGRSLAAAVGPEFTEVVQAVSEAAHSRWINLLAARCLSATAWRTWDALAAHQALFCQEPLCYCCVPSIRHCPLACRSATVTALELSQLKELLDTSESFAQTMQEAGCGRCWLCGMLFR